MPISCGCVRRTTSNWRQDPRRCAAYLDRLWGFVKTLDPVHNSLKAHVLYH